MPGLSRFERPVVVQFEHQSSERIVFDVDDAAAILLRELGSAGTVQTLGGNDDVNVCLGSVSRRFARPRSEATNLPDCGTKAASARS